MSRQTKRLFSFSQHDNVVLGYLLRPSWFSGLFAVVASTGVVLSAVLSAIHYSSASLSGGLQQLFNLHTNSPPTDFNNVYQTLGNNFSANTIISDIPLFIFWAGVGLGVYSFAASVTKHVVNAAETAAELNYINADRHEIIRTSIEHLAIRVATLVAWFALLRYTFHSMLPYVIAMAHVGIATASKLAAAGYTLGGILLLAVFLHFNTIMLRLLLLKPRVFWQSAYD